MEMISPPHVDILEEFILEFQHLLEEYTRIIDTLIISIHNKLIVDTHWHCFLFSSAEGVSNLCLNLNSKQTQKLRHGLAISRYRNTFTYEYDILITAIHFTVDNGKTTVGRQLQSSLHNNY